MTSHRLHSANRLNEDSEMLLKVVRFSLIDFISPLSINAAFQRVFGTCTKQPVRQLKHLKQSAGAVDQV